MVIAALSFRGDNTKTFRFNSDDFLLQSSTTLSTFSQIYSMFICMFFFSFFQDHSLKPFFFFLKRCLGVSGWMFYLTTVSRFHITIHTNASLCHGEILSVDLRPKTS